MTENVLCYFIDEGTVYFAHENHDSTWRQMGNVPLLRSGPCKTIRDPFIGNYHDGKYRILHTESWHGQSIGYAESSDLHHWHQRKIFLNIGEAAWAPEFIVDANTETHMIYWTQFVQKMPSIWYCHTKDFFTFSTPQVLFNPGYPVIDAQLQKITIVTLWAYKDEREEYKAIRLAFSETLIGPYLNHTDCLTPYGSEGPILRKDDNTWKLYYDKYITNEWGLLLSRDTVHWLHNPLKMPSGARHGSILAIDQHIIKKLKKTILTKMA